MKVRLFAIILYMCVCSAEHSRPAYLLSFLTDCFAEPWRNRFLPDPTFIYWTLDGIGSQLQYEHRMSCFCLYNKCHTDRGTYLQSKRMWLSGAIFRAPLFLPHPRSFFSPYLLNTESYGLPSVSAFSLHVNKVLHAPKSQQGSQKYTSY